MLRRAGIAFAIAITLYVGFYSCDRHLRQHRGSWEITFAPGPAPERSSGSISNSSTRAPSVGVLITINQPGLGITNQSILFSGAAVGNPPSTRTLLFESPDTLPRLPFGSLVFHDLMYLPGTLTFDFFGHQVELLPRVLIIDKEEHPWQSGSRLKVSDPGSD